MADAGWVLFGAVALLAIAGAALRRPLKARFLERQFGRARRDFHRQRERLEAKFVCLIASKGRGSPEVWDRCRFDDDVAYVRNRTTGELAAFAAFSFGLDTYDSRPGPPYSGLGNLRAGTAVFRFNGRRWDTEGRAILNLSPCEAIRFYQDDLEMVGQE